MTTQTSHSIEGGSRELVAVAPPALYTAAPFVLLSSSQDVIECSAGVDYVDCSVGFLAGNNTVSCATACGGNCCVGSNACFKFVGKVCRDGSCSGSNACANAKIPLVVNSCRNSTNSTTSECQFAGSGGGTVVTGMKNSCNGDKACQYLGQGPGAAGNQGSGKVGYLIDSCNGSFGCSYAASKGKIGFIKNSCNGERACNDLALGGGVSRNIQDSCNAGYSCDGVAKGTSKFIGDIAMSCNALKACQLLSGTNSTNLFSCCNSDNECTSKNATNLPTQCSVRILHLLCFFALLSCQNGFKFQLHTFLFLFPADSNTIPFLAVLGAGEHNLHAVH